MELQGTQHRANNILGFRIWLCMFFSHKADLIWPNPADHSTVEVCIKPDLEALRETMPKSSIFLSRAYELKRRILAHGKWAKDSLFVHKYFGLSSTWLVSRNTLSQNQTKHNNVLAENWELWKAANHVWLQYFTYTLPNLGDKKSHVFQIRLSPPFLKKMNESRRLLDGKLLHFHINSPINK